MAEHELKTWPTYFEHVVSGLKTFEIRRNDRQYTPGDVLVLREWIPGVGEYTGREVRKQVGYVLHGGQFGLKSGYVAMALSTVDGEVA